MPHSEPINGHQSNGSLPPRRGVWLLTHPRSASNLFQTMMSKQKSYGAVVQSSGYHFFEAAFPTLMQMAKGSLKSKTEVEREALHEKYREALEKLNGEFATAEKNGQQVFVKEHAPLLASPDKLYSLAYAEDDCKDKEPFLLRSSDADKEAPHTNPTYLTDNFLLAMQPVFQIRHPALMFPSLLRTERKAQFDWHPIEPQVATLMTLQHSRALFDWYSSHPQALSPKVIDADDIMNDREAVRKLCVDVDFDPDAVQYEWETRTVEDPLMAVFLGTINASKGIKPGLDARCLDLEVEKAKWVEEFGEKDGEDLARFVSDAMPDYEYLLKHRVRGSQ